MTLNSNRLNGHLSKESVRQRQALHARGDHSNETLDQGDSQAPTSNGYRRLLRYEELPDYLQKHPFIKGGYTGPQTKQQCWRNLFRWTNETVNIWSHLLTFFLLLGYLAYDNWWTIPELNGSFIDHVLISAELLSFMTCAFCSCGFHLFRCRSASHYNFWFGLDLAGIAGMGVGIYLPGLHFLFFCFPTERLMYMTAASVLVCAMVVCMPLASLRRFCVPLAVGLVGFGVVPAVHWVQLMGGVTGRFAQVFLPRLYTAYSLIALTGAVYVAKVPERLLNGGADMLGASHQLWHLLVAVSFVYWHNTVLLLLREKNIDSCP